MTTTNQTWEVEYEDWKKLVELTNNQQLLKDAESGFCEGYHVARMKAIRILEEQGNSALASQLEKLL